MSNSTKNRRTPSFQIATQRTPSPVPVADFSVRIIIMFPARVPRAMQLLCFQAPVGFSYCQSRVSDRFSSPSVLVSPKHHVCSVLSVGRIGGQFPVVRRDELNSRLKRMIILHEIFLFLNFLLPPFPWVLALSLLSLVQRFFPLSQVCVCPFSMQLMKS